MARSVFIRACAATLIALLSTILAIAGMSQSVFYSCSQFSLRVDVGLLQISTSGDSISNCDLRVDDAAICASTRAMLGLGILGTLLAAAATGCDIACVACTQAKKKSLWHAACVLSAVGGALLAAGSIGVMAGVGSSRIADSIRSSGGTCAPGAGAVLCLVG